MDFTNINDPAGVKALLDQLRESQAWQELGDDSAVAPPLETKTSHQPNIIRPIVSEKDPEPSPAISSHISSLLSRLQPAEGGISTPSPATNSQTSTQASSQAVSLPKIFRGATTPSPKSVAEYPSPRSAKDLRSLNFTQSLPIIAQLSEDANFMDKLTKFRKDQEHLERNLWRERTNIVKSQEEKARVAQVKASMLGTGLSQKDADMLQASFERELKAFDRERVLPAWDSLLAKQQAAFEALRVPSMFTTTTPAAREKQQKVIQVLEGLADAGNEG